MRNHPTMFNAVYPVHKRPLVVRTNVDYEFTTITVDQVAAADGNYEVLFLGTGELTTHLRLIELYSYFYFVHKRWSLKTLGHFQILNHSGYLQTTKRVALLILTLLYTIKQLYI